MTMTPEKRPLAFWGLCVFLVLTAGMVALGQTSAVFAYDFAVQVGLQEPVDQMSPFGVAVNRAFGLSDTLVYLPLIVIALVGLVRKRSWALPVTAAVMGISAYWATTCSAIFVFVVGHPAIALLRARSIGSPWASILWSGYGVFSTSYSVDTTWLDIQGTG